MGFDSVRHVGVVMTKGIRVGYRRSVGWITLVYSCSWKIHLHEGGSIAMFDNPEGNVLVVLVLVTSMCCSSWFCIFAFV